MPPLRTEGFHLRPEYGRLWYHLSPLIIFTPYAGLQVAMPPPRADRYYWCEYASNFCLRGMARLFIELMQSWGDGDWVFALHTARYVSWWVASNIKMGHTDYSALVMAPANFYAPTPALFVAGPTCSIYSIMTFRHFASYCQPHWMPEARTLPTREVSL